jgi:hypothetical protein
MLRVKVFHTAVFFFVCIIAGAQSSIFVEGGPGFSMPLDRHSGPYSPSTYGIQNKISTGIGFYLKSGININLYKKNNFRFDLPVGVSHFYYSQQFSTEFYGTNGRPNLYWRSTTKTQYIGCFFGPQLTFSKDRFSVYGNLLFNGMAIYMSKDYEIDEHNFYRVYTRTFADQFLYVISSGGFGASYGVNNFSLGLNADVYFFNLLSRYSSFTSSYFTFTGIGNQIWINPGIRIQYHLK